ncbi:MAG: hypothetical protein QXI12_05405 [Candidatus Methanomethyliaceae archaeon]
MDHEIIEKLKKIAGEITKANEPLRRAGVKKEDITRAFDLLSDAENMLWELRDQVEERGVGYPGIRRLEELLTDMQVEHSLPSIQFLLRVLLQSRTLSSEEAQERITMASVSLRKFQAALAALERELGKTPTL